MKKTVTLILAAILLLTSSCMAFAEDATPEMTILDAPAAAQPFTAETLGGVALDSVEKTEAAYTYTNWSNVAATVDLYTITIPAGTRFVKVYFDSAKLCYNYAFTGDGAASVTDSDYLSGVVADENTQDGRVSFTIPVDSKLVNYDGTTAPADGVIDYVQIQTPYDSDWNTTVLYALTFQFSEKNDEIKAASSFSDVDSDADYAEAISWAHVQGITSGMGSGRFGTGRKVTRAQLATFVWNLAGCPKSDTDIETVFYNDVSADQYYTQAIDWAYSNGLMDGAEAHTFGVSQIAGHGEIVSVLSKYTGRTAEEISAFVPEGNNREDVVAAIYNLVR